jgi:hypothetical protein
MVPKGPVVVVIMVPVGFAAANAGALAASGPMPIPAAIIANEITVFVRVSRRTDFTIHPPVVD